MLITCPECRFSREIDESKIPERSVVATCPKCKTKFTFRALPEEADDFTLEAAQEQPAAEPEQKPQPTPGKNFPDLHDPAEDPGDELWRKIGDMSPPQGEEKPLLGQEEETPAQPERPVIEVPFERLDKFGFFPGIFSTIKRVLFAPHLFFNLMPLGRGIVRPLVFALLILVLHDVLQAAFLQAGLLPTLGLGGEAMTPPEPGSFSPFALIVFSPFLWTVVLFLSAGLHHLILMALKAADGKFEATFRAAAYATAPIIIAYIPLPFELAFKAQMILIFVWNLAITVVGWKYLHRTSFLRAGLAAAIPMLVLGAAVLSSLSGSAPMV